MSFCETAQLLPVGRVASELATRCCWLSCCAVAERGGRRKKTTGGGKKGSIDPRKRTSTRPDRNKDREGRGRRGNILPSFSTFGSWPARMV